MFTPYDFQKEAIDSVFKYFYSGKKGNPLVVAPTGSGKSVIIACMCQTIVESWPSQKILVISHVKEILDQNYRAIKKQNPTCKIGLYSAGLKSKTIQNITVAGIQSIYNKPELFDRFNIVIVDECHTIPLKKNGMYPKFFNQVKKPIIGFTATPFRLGTGYLHLGDTALFDDIVYTIPIKKLQDEGYLCKLTTKGTRRKLDAEGIRKQAGDYVVKELSMAFNRKAITKDIIKELLIHKTTRKKWLVFAIDIEHCENITQDLNEAGIKADYVHSRMHKNRDDVIDTFRNGDCQALVSVAVLTTGFDVPKVDLIALLRPTQSPTLHVQIIGRGLRTSEGKKDCLVLDFAGNLIRNGPIDAPVIRLKGDGKGEPIMKECENCFEIVHAAVRVCPVCGTKFLFRHKLSAQSETAALLSIEEWHDVSDVKYFVHTGSKGIPMLKVSYICGLRRFNDFVCLEHSGYTKRKARFWWGRRSTEPVPETAAEAKKLSHTLIKPKKILVEESGRYPDIKDMEF